MKPQQQNAKAHDLRGFALSGIRLLARFTKYLLLALPTLFLRRGRALWAALD
jgi:hypothetical protein